MKDSRPAIAVAWISALVMATSALALAGWASGIDWMKGMAPGFIAMNPLTAVSLFAAGVSLWLRRDGSIAGGARRAGALVGCGVAAAGGLRFADYVFPIALDFDRALFASSLGDNRMAPNTALCLFIAGLGLTTLDVTTKRGFWPAHVFALLVGAISLVCLTGYAYGAESLYQVASFFPMALNTAAIVLALAVGMLLAHPRRGIVGVVLSPCAGGGIARSLLPLMVGIPVVVGWARIAGERAGWYDARFGTAINVTVMMLLLMAAVGWIAASLNRSDAARREAAEELRRVNESLEQRVRERTVELAATNADLVLKNEENEMFVYSVSHDLRSPLVNLQGFSNELSGALGDVRKTLSTSSLPAAEKAHALRLVDDDMPQSIRFIQAAVSRLSGIIDALLRLSRAGRVEYQVQSVDVEAVARRVIESMSGTIFDSGVRVAVDPLPPVHGDPTAIEQIFANLIGNAVNYLDRSRPGEIAVGSRPAASPTGDGAAWTTYFVRDNGLGIAEAYHAKVFQALKRLHPEAAKGEGIGLAIVRRVAERHGGSVWFESTPGVGSTFYVTLPSGVVAARAGRDSAPSHPNRSMNNDDRSVGNLVGGRR